MTQEIKDIRNLRILKNKSFHQLVEACGFAPSKLRVWERGFELPPDNAISKIATFLGASSDVLKKNQKRFMQLVIPGEGYTTSKSSDTKIYPRHRNPTSNKLKVLDLFCGAGGFSYGFEQTGHFTVTAGIDLLHDRVKTFSLNHPYATAIAADIRKFHINELEEIALQPDIVIGGPPCQGFSSIRPFRNLTENDPRNSLPEYYFLVITKIKPRWFVFENVVGLLSHEGGNFFRSLVNSFEEVGYNTDWRIVNAAYYGLPQNRERLILVGSRDGEKFKWPEPSHLVKHRSMANSSARKLHPNPLFDKLKPAVTAWEAIKDLPPLKAGENISFYFNSAEISEYALKLRNGTNDLTLHNATEHSPRMMEIIRKSGSNRWVLPKELTTSGFSTCYSRLDPDRPSVTLTVNFVHPSSNKCIHPFQDRALTPREGARLQGFPDNFHFFGNRTQIVKQIGNAVPPILGKTIAKGLIDSSRLPSACDIGGKI